MSTLKTLLSERRAAELPTGAHTTAAVAQSPAVLVFKWTGQSWVLPWSYFLGAHHEVVESDEQLTLSFSLCEVVLTGKRLALLLPDIAAYRLESLHELPDKYRDENSAAPLIREIVVKSTGKAGERERQSDPDVTVSSA